MRQTDPKTASLPKAESPDGDDAEFYRTIYQSPHYRIGHGTRIAADNTLSSFVEVAVTLLHDRPRINVSLLKKDLRIIETLQARGYTLNCHDDACVSAELYVPPQTIQAECLGIKKMIEGIMAGHS
ncbi:hypothetical protein [Methanocella sp. MCL-LM]|uniref:hypothetical protein n=1 Tax=Methanocella sp. MCL-LM TaxID=3412035 RepID=UPI003C77E053